MCKLLSEHYLICWIVALVFVLWVFRTPRSQK